MVQVGNFLERLGKTTINISLHSPSPDRELIRDFLNIKLAIPPSL
jgi:hypothetical protein